MSESDIPWECNCCGAKNTGGWDALQNHLSSCAAYQRLKSRPRGILSRKIEVLEKRCDKLEHALITLASWVQDGQWSGAHEYINAMLSDDKKDRR